METQQMRTATRKATGMDTFPRQMRTVRGTVPTCEKIPVPWWSARLYGHGLAVIALMFLLPLCSLAQSDVAVERADSLVGKSVVVQNVFHNTGGVTITKLKSAGDVEAARKALQAALRKYPASFITRVLNTVYVGSDLKRTDTKEKKNWGGLYCYKDKTIYMKFTGNPSQFESVFHHELAHGIHFAYRAQFDEKAWLAANPSGFEYTGVADAGPPSAELLQQGFVRPYAMFSLQEDVACVAENLIGDTEDFSKGVGRFGRVDRKARLLIALYQAVDPVMTVSYFRLQQAVAERKAEAVTESVADERGRPIWVSSQTERGAFMGNFKEGDCVTLYYRDGDKPRSKTTLTFAPESPRNIALCRRRKARSEPELTVLAAVPSLTRDVPFKYTFSEACAAVLKMNGEASDGVDKVKFEFQVDRSGRH